jgi:hypothetical protein
MKKNTMYLVGGLAILGVGYYILNKKNNQNSSTEDYSNASGMSTFFQQVSDRNIDNFAKAKMITCKRLDGSYYQEQQGRKCINGAVQV